MEQAKYTAHQIALWLANWADRGDEEEAEDLTNLKMQKLLYYAQGHYLAKYGHPLFSDSIEAWQHGPVVPNIYRDMKYHRDVLAPSNDYDWDSIDEETASFLAGIWNAYGQYSAWKLRNMTHATTPWRDHFDPTVKHSVIPDDEIRRYFLGVQAANDQ